MDFLASFWVLFHSRPGRSVQRSSPPREKPDQNLRTVRVSSAPEPHHPPSYWTTSSADFLTCAGLCKSHTIPWSLVNSTFTRGSDPRRGPGRPRRKSLISTFLVAAVSSRAHAILVARARLDFRAMPCKWVSHWPLLLKTRL